MIITVKCFTEERNKNEKRIPRSIPKTPIISEQETLSAFH